MVGVNTMYIFMVYIYLCKFGVWCKHIRCAYGILGREFIKCTVTHTPVTASPRDMEAIHRICLVWFGSITFAL